MNERGPRPGLECSIEYTVEAAHLASEYGNKGFPVLATPVVAAWMEATSIACLADALPEGDGTVGTQLTLRHEAPTAEGGSVVVVARLLEVDRRRLRFELLATEGEATIATAEHERFVVNIDKFVASTVSTSS